MLDEWIAAGYKRFETRNNSLNKNSDFGLQKLFRDEIGKRYYITVYVYDRTRYPGYPWLEKEPQQYGFMPTAQFHTNDTTFFNIEMNQVSGPFNIAEMEEWFDSLWRFFGKPYYRKDGE